MASKVFFTRKITPEAVAELYKKLDERFMGDVQFKISKVQSNPLTDTNTIK